MESFAIDKSLYDIGEHDLKEFWDGDFDSPMADAFNSEQDWANLLDNQPVILHDRMITDAAQSPRIQSEHSYSLSASDDMPGSPMSIHIIDKFKLEDFGKDLESECFPAIPMNTSCSNGSVDVQVKQEPLSAPSSPQPMLSSCSSPFSDIDPSHFFNGGNGCGHSINNHMQHPHTILKQPTIVLATKPSLKNGRQVFPKVKVENALSGFSLPPTPPSSNSSDSEGSLSPVYSQQPSSPPSLLSCPSATSRKHGPQTRMASSPGTCLFSNGIGSSSSSKHSSNTPLISSQPKGATGVLNLTEEEKRTLLAEGYPIPTRLPLTKAEEKSLKKIRRKIKNKISAQESRRKKKEYMDALEKKVENLAHENNEYQRRLDSLECNNKSLLSQLNKLQGMLGELPNKMSRTVYTQTSTPFMVLLLFFVLCLGSWGPLASNSFSLPSLPTFLSGQTHEKHPVPFTHPKSDLGSNPYFTPNTRIRSLHSIADEHPSPTEHNSVTFSNPIDDLLDTPWPVSTKRHLQQASTSKVRKPLPRNVTPVRPNSTGADTGAP